MILKEYTDKQLLKRYNKSLKALMTKFKSKKIKDADLDSSFIILEHIIKEIVKLNKKINAS
jgi:hypothetical protein